MKKIILFYPTVVQNNKDTFLSHFSSFLKCSFLSLEEVVRIPQLLSFIPESISFLTNLLELTHLKTSQKSKQNDNTDPALLPAEQIQYFAYATACREMPCWAQCRKSIPTALWDTRPAIHIPTNPLVHSWSKLTLTTHLSAIYISLDPYVSSFQQD